MYFLHLLLIFKLNPKKKISNLPSSNSFILISQQKLIHDFFWLLLIFSPITKHCQSILKVMIVLSIQELYLLYPSRYKPKSHRHQFLEKCYKVIFVC